MDLSKSFKNLSIHKPVLETTSTISDRKERIPFLYLRKDSQGKNIPTVIKFLHSYDKSVDLSIHNVYEDRNSNNFLCEKYWQDTCQFCNKKCYLKAVKCLVSFVVSLVGKQWSMVNEKGESKSGSYQVVRLVTIPLGRNDVNVEPLSMAHNEKIFSDRMWMLSKSPKIIATQTVNVLNPPRIIYDTDYKKYIGEDLPKFAYPDNAEKYRHMTEDEIFAAIVKSFTNGPELINFLNKEQKKEVPIENVGDDFEDVDIF